jgi:hypothetical protein
MDLTASVHQNVCKSRKNCDGGRGNNETSIRGRRHEPYTECLNSQRPKKARQMKSNVKSTLVIFFGMKGIFHK